MLRAILFKCCYRTWLALVLRVRDIPGSSLCCFDLYFFSQSVHESTEIVQRYILYKQVFKFLGKAVKIKIIFKAKFK